MKRWPKSNMLYCPHKDGASKACIERCIYFIDEGDLGGCMLVDKLEKDLAVKQEPAKRIGRPPKLPQGE